MLCKCCVIGTFSKVFHDWYRFFMHINVNFVYAYLVGEIIEQILNKFDEDILIVVPVVYTVQL